MLPWLLSSCAAVAAWLWLLWLCGCCGSAVLWPLWLLWVGAMTLLLYTAHVPARALHIHNPCAPKVARPAPLIMLLPFGPVDVKYGRPFKEGLREASGGRFQAAVP